jgi:hypothetical protein
VALYALLSACDAEAPPPAPLAPSVAVTPRPPRPYYEATLPPAPPPETRERERVRVVEGSSDAPDRVRRTGRPIDLDLRDVDIANVCRLLADVGRVNIVLGDDVHGQVTVKMTGVPWDTALDVILRAKGLRAESMADVIIVHAK